MNPFKLTLKPKFHLIVLPLTTVFFSWLAPVQAQTQTTSNHQFTATKITPVVSFEPPDDQKIDDSRGGASRPIAVKCSQDGQTVAPAMTPLTPNSRPGLTVAPRPTFYVYIPPTSAPQAHFTLRDENNRGIYQTLLPISNTGGVVSITLPTEQPPLELGKTYQWSVALLCQPSQTDTPMVAGQVRRVELKSRQTSPLNSSSITSQKALLEQAALYGRAGLWYDSVNLLAQLRKTQPNDQALASNWVKLLDSVGLKAISSQPLLQ